MAITIYQSPQTFSPGYCPLIFVVRSSNISEANFKYIATLKNADTNVALATVKLPARPDGNAVFNFGRILESYIQSVAPVAEAAGFYSNPDSVFKYKVAFGEEYGDPVAEYEALTTSSNFYVWNGVFSIQEFVDYDDADYLIISGSQKSVLTNAPRTQDIRTGSAAWIYAITNEAFAINQALVSYYDAAGSLLDSTTITNSYSLVLNTPAHYVRLAIGPANLNTDIPSGCAYYTVELQNSESDATSELFRFDIVDANCLYTPYRLHFLNRLGGYDSFDFMLVNKTSHGIERKTYEPFPGTLDDTSWGYSLSSHEVRQYSTRVSERVRLTSDWITDAQSAWLKELIASPRIYWERTTGVFVAVNATAQGYEVKKRVSDGLFNLEFEISLNHQNESQRG